MAGGVNKVMLIGNLGNDPEMRVTPSGQTVANFRIATNESWTDKSGAKQERTEWHRIVVWGKQAENCGKYLKKGRRAYVEGRLQTREWNDKEGKKNWTTEIVAQSVQFLDSARSDGPRNDDMDAPPSEEAPGNGGDFGAPARDDDVPF